MKKNIIYSLMLFLMAIGFVACQDTTSDVLNNNAAQRNSKFRFYLSVPNENVATTRGYNEIDTYKVDEAKLKVLLFKNNTYVQTCKLENIQENLQGATKEYEIKLEIPKSTDPVDFVVIANQDIPVGILEEGKTSKKDFYEAFQFNTSKAWGNKLLPMWGELNGINLDQAPDQLRVKLLRSVARLDFSYPTNAKFAVSKVYVYNTLASGMMVPDGTNLTTENGHILVSKPTQPQTVMYNSSTTPNANASTAQNNPIIISHDESDASSILTFIPEQLNNSDGPKPALVLEIQNKNDNNSLSYYKIDFDIKEGDKVRKSVDILRNYKYLVTVNSVTGLGYPTPKAALQGEAANIDVDLVRWEENINEGYIFGSKYFGIATTDIHFEGGGKDQETSFIFQSNIDKVEETLSLGWKSGGRTKGKFFSVAQAIQAGKPVLVVKTLTDNNTSSKIEDELIINAVGHQFNIKVTQNNLGGSYDLNCRETKIIGVYREEVNVAGSNNYIEVVITTDTPATLNNKRYELRTNEVDGISFYGEGVFKTANFDATTKSMKVKLMAKGLTHSKYPKKFTITSNSETGTNCEATLKMTARAVRVSMLTLENGDKGFGDASQSGYSKMIKEYPSNFGLLSTSVVKIPPFKTSTSGSSSVPTTNSISTFYNLSSIDTDSKFATMLSRSDIVIVGDGFQIHEKYVKRLSDYLINNRGVVLIFNDAVGTYKSFYPYLFKRLSKNEEVEVQVSAQPAPTTVTATGIKSSGLVFHLENRPGDPIIDGPFNVSGQSVKYWGAGSAGVECLSGLPLDEIVLYSKSVNVWEKNKYAEKGITMFRSTKVNLFVVGNGEFLKRRAASTGSGPTSSTTEPMEVANKAKGDYTPIYKENYGSGELGGVLPVGNAIIFANALAWAIERAQYEGPGVKN